MPERRTSPGSRLGRYCVRGVGTIFRILLPLCLGFVAVSGGISAVQVARSPGLDRRGNLTAGGRYTEEPGAPSAARMRATLMGEFRQAGLSRRCVAGLEFVLGHRSLSRAGEYSAASRRIRVHRLPGRNMVDAADLWHELGHHFYDTVASPAQRETLDDIIRTAYLPTLSPWLKPVPAKQKEIMAYRQWYLGYSARPCLPESGADGFDELRAAAFAHYFSPGPVLRAVAQRHGDPRPHGGAGSAGRQALTGYAAFRRDFAPAFGPLHAQPDPVLPGDFRVTFVGGIADFPAVFRSNSRHLLWCLAAGAGVLARQVGHGFGLPGTGAEPPLQRAGSAARSGTGP